MIPIVLQLLDAYQFQLHVCRLVQSKQYDDLFLTIEMCEFVMQQIMKTVSQMFVVPKESQFQRHIIIMVKSNAVFARRVSVVTSMSHISEDQCARSSVLDWPILFKISINLIHFLIVSKQKLISSLQ